MEENLALAPVMSRAACQAVLHRVHSNDFESVIVYLPRYERHDRTWTSENGLFQEFSLNMTFWGTGTDDWQLDEDHFLNDNGSAVKSVYVSFEDFEYFEAFLYSRVRKHTPYRQIRDVNLQLNKHLDLYRDELRLGIAQEWCDQEPWRILPRFIYQCISEVFNNDGTNAGWTYPEHDIAAIMSSHLPRGYDEDLPATDIL